MVKQDCKFPAVRSEAVSEAEACPETGKSMQLLAAANNRQIPAGRLRQRKCYGSTNQSFRGLLLPDDNSQRKRPLVGLALEHNSDAFSERSFPLVVLVFTSEKTRQQSREQPRAR